MSALARLGRLWACAALLTGCAGTTEVQRYPAFGERPPVRLVLMPFESGSERVPGSACELVTSRVLGELSASARYQVISPVDVRIALERAGSDPRAAVVRAFAPDGILRGRVQHFEGRSGPDGVPRGPARVEFSLLLEAADGTPLWQARYAEQQRPLSEDLGALARSWSRGFRWVSPERLAADGARELVSALDRAESSPAAAP